MAQHDETPLLGEHQIRLATFPALDRLFGGLVRDPSWSERHDQAKQDAVSALLLRCIQEAPAPCFLLRAVVDFLERVRKAQLLEGSYLLSHFEFWLNQHAGLSPQENQLVRAKMVGKWLPRQEFQLLFPIGMDKTFAGSHCVTAHGSPDLDTTIASFWGWMDAFGARVSEGLHLWNVPGGPPVGQMEISYLFEELFGASLFPLIAKTRSALALSSVDLISQKAVLKKRGEERALSVDHGRSQKAVLVVDEEGYFLGDWRPIDVEGVRQVLMLVSSCLHGVERAFHTGLISLFAQADLRVADLRARLQALQATPLLEASYVRDDVQRQREQLDLFLKRILRLPEGAEATVSQLMGALELLEPRELGILRDLLAALESSALFDAQGLLTENRSLLFLSLERVMLHLDRALQACLTYFDRLDIAIKIKREVLGYEPHTLSPREEVEEIRQKMQGYDHLTVTIADAKGRSLPLGVVHAHDLYRSTLGTVTLRDFCNRDETKIPSYLEVISVVDHHKSSLTTLAPAVAFVSDMQSANSLLAELAFVLNDRYSLGGMELGEIDRQIEAMDKSPSTPAQKRVLQRLLQRKIVAETRGDFFVDPQREYAEYLHFLYAILDDTDLLTKVTHRDLLVVAALLNRLKSLMMRREQETIILDDLLRGPSFIAAAARRILQNGDMHSLYGKIYAHKERIAEESLSSCAAGRPSLLFNDTKQQNGCCRVGQTKLFASNFPLFIEVRSALRTAWGEAARAFYAAHGECDLYLHMISTIAGVEELYEGRAPAYAHRDEIWIWIPPQDSAIQHLKSFLQAFQGAALPARTGMRVALFGPDVREYERIFRESFTAVPCAAAPAEEQSSLALAVLTFEAGTLNSRKAMISPYLPKLPA